MKRSVTILVLPRWSHCALRPNAPGTSSMGIAGLAGTGTGRDGQTSGKREFPSAWDDDKIIGHIQELVDVLIVSLAMSQARNL